MLDVGVENLFPNNKISFREKAFGLRDEHFGSQVLLFCKF
jgi:hypothetical protein